MPLAIPSPFTSLPTLLFLSLLLRCALFAYGLYQDAHFPAKYTDIDYLVFTDAARFVAGGGSPYERATYRYTPLLAWLLLPTALDGGCSGSWLWFSFGKAVFAAADMFAGWLLIRILTRHMGIEKGKALRYVGCGWLLNPMVAVISTRGSAEGVLGVLVIALLCAVLEKRAVCAGGLLGFGVHFKIYPFIYASSVFLAFDEGRKDEGLAAVLCRPWKVVNRSRAVVALTSLTVFMGLNGAMYGVYGGEFVQETFLHHFVRVDHRHNFSPYNMLLYLSSATSASEGAGKGVGKGMSIESLAFIPQLALSAVLIPLALAKRELAGCMLAQTFAFVAFNKVCTSQYFLWYIVFLPLYYPYSTFLRSRVTGLVALAAWSGAQALWLQQGYKLEFLGESTFVPGLFVGGVVFFGVNVWVLGVIVGDVAGYRRGER